MLNFVLWQPEIPPNTGNVARLAVALNAMLHLVGPLGFRLGDRQLRRAGLDYWKDVCLVYHSDPAAFTSAHPDPVAWYFTTRGKKLLWDAVFGPDDFLFFGSETSGLPAEILESNPGRCLLIPQSAKVRSLNLANCVAIAAYEAMRQQMRSG